MKLFDFVPVALAAWVPAWAANPQILSVQSAASSAQGLPARGSLATLFATGLDDVPPLTTARQFPLPRELAGVSVTVRGVQAPLLAVANFGSFQQVNFQVPNEPAGSECVVVGPPGIPPVSVGVQHGALSFETSVLPITVQGLSPGPGDIFPVGQGGAFFHADFSLITPDRPAVPGETIIILATGLGFTSPVVPTGEPAPVTEPLARFAPRQQCPLAQIDDYSVDISDSLNVDPLPLVPDFVGLMPGLAGVFQINVRLPGILGGRAPFLVYLSRGYCQFTYFCFKSAYSSTPRVLPLQR